MDMAPTGTRILVVDDDHNSAQMLAEMLRYKGYEPHVATSGEAALALAEQMMPAIAVLDISLPEMDGYELAGRLREITGLANIRLIAVTGFGRDSDRVKTSAAGFHKHLVKPVNMHTIDSTLRTTLEGISVEASDGEPASAG
jgi:CheY-like chemotaxis protein